MLGARLPRAAGCAALFVVLCLVARPARAHDPFEITTDAHVTRDALRVHTTLSLGTAARLCRLGAGPERRLEATDFESERAALTRCARDYYQISAGGEPLALRSVTVALGAEDDLEIELFVARPEQSPLVFDAVGLKGLAVHAGVVLTVTGERTFLGQKVLRPDDTRLALPITADAEAPGTPLLPSFTRFLRLGVEHILSGADHLLFLLALLVVCRRFRTVAILVTCFSVAHSLTLLLATSGVLQLSPRVIEPLIALTIVLVGLENLYLGEEPEGRWVTRWLATFAFGLIHGLGFAGALQKLGLGTRGTSLLSPLLAFNLGVELGQLAVACVVLAALVWLRRHPRWSKIPRIVSVGIIAVGLFWLVQRLVA